VGWILLSVLPGRRERKGRSRFARAVFCWGVVLLVSPLVLLHGASFLFSLHDRSMRAFDSRTMTDSFGHRLHFYQQRQHDADWDIVFIHGTPATGAIFGEQFKHPFPRANLVALDRPGFGRSGPGRKKPSLDDQANAVGTFLAF
jgi:hypothetical protein